MYQDMLFCTGEGCSLRSQCLRYRLIAYGRRSSFGSPPFDPGTGRCPHLAPVSVAHPDQAQIQTRAYFLWQREGQPEGRAAEHWRRAEEELWIALHAQLRPE